MAKTSWPGFTKARIRAARTWTAREHEAASDQVELQHVGCCNEPNEGDAHGVAMDEAMDADLREWRREWTASARMALR